MLGTHKTVYASYQAAYGSLDHTYRLDAAFKPNLKPYLLIVYEAHNLTTSTSSSL